MLFGKGGFRDSIGSLLGQGDFGELCVTIKWSSGGFFSASHWLLVNLPVTE